MIWTFSSFCHSSPKNLSGSEVKSGAFQDFQGLMLPLQLHPHQILLLLSHPSTHPTLPPPGPFLCPWLLLDLCLFGLCILPFRLISTGSSQRLSPKFHPASAHSKFLHPLGAFPCHSVRLGARGIYVYISQWCGLSLQSLANADTPDLLAKLKAFPMTVHFSLVYTKKHKFSTHCRKPDLLGQTWFDQEKNQSD